MNRKQYKFKYQYKKCFDKNGRNLYNNGMITCNTAS